MPTRESIIRQVKEQDPSFDGMSDDKIIALMKKAQPDLVIDDEEGLLEGGFGDFGKSVLGGVDNLMADLTNLTVGQITGREYQPIGVTSGLREKEAYGKGGLLQRNIDIISKKGGELGRGVTRGLEGEQTALESGFQTGGAIIGGLVEVFGETVGTGLLTVAPDNLEKKVKEKVQEGLTETTTGQFIANQMNEFQTTMDYLEKNNPRVHGNYNAGFDILEGAFEAVGLKKVSGIYKWGGEVKNIPVAKIKEITQEATKKLQESLRQTGEFVKQGKDITFEKTKEILGNIPKPSKEYQKGVSKLGTEFEVEKTPTIYEGFQDIFSSNKNEDLAGGSVFPKLTKGKTTKQKLNANNIALKSVEQLYDDKARGIVKADINEMGGGIEGIDEGLKYWGKKIGEYTDLDATVNIENIVDQLASVLDKKYAKSNPTMYGIIKDKYNLLKEGGYTPTVKELQELIGDFKSDVFSNFETTKQLASSSQGRAFGRFLDDLQEKFDTTIDITTGDSKQLREAKGKYSNYLKIQKDLVDSFLVTQRRGIKGGLSTMAGNMGGAMSVLQDPTGFGILKGLLLKQGGELMGRARSRDGQWETLIRNMDRKSVREYNLRTKQNERLADNNDIDSTRVSDTSVRGGIDSVVDVKKSSRITDQDTLEFVQDVAKQIEESIGDTDRLTEIKQAINEIELPKKYKEILEEKVDSHIRDVENYKKEVESGKTPFDDDIEVFSLSEHYGDSLTRAFNRLGGIQERTKTTKGGDKMSKIEFETTPAYKTFSDNAEEFINERYGDSTDIPSVQEIFEEMQDMVGQGVSTKVVKVTPTKKKDLHKKSFDKPQTKKETGISKKGGLEGISPDYQHKFNQGPSYKAVRVISNAEDSRVIEYGSLNTKSKKDYSESGAERMTSIENELGMTRKEILSRSDEIKDLAKKIRSKNEEKVLNLNEGQKEKIIGSTQRVDWGKGDMNLKTYTKGDAKLEVLEDSPFAEGRNSIYDTFVPEQQRRKGIASEMIQEAQKEYNNLSAQIGNEGSVRLYYKNGFRPFDNPKATIDETIDIFNKENNINMNWENEKFQKAELVGQGEEISQAEGKKIVEKYFKADEVGVEFVDNITTPEGLEALGKYRDKLITFSKNPLESTPEHEVLHAFFDTMTTPERKIKVLDDIKVKEKFDNDLDAEEWLADNFVNFARNREVSGITENVKQYFSDMLRGLKTIFFEGDVVENLYRDLENLTKQRGISKPKAVIIGGATKEDEE